jgi:hypothetical protein
MTLMWINEGLPSAGGCSLKFCYAGRTCVFCSNSLQADACGPTYTYDSNSRLKLEAKDHMRARGVKSPDEWDAVAPTFAEPVAKRSDRTRRKSEMGRSGPPHCKVRERRQ